MFPKDSLVITMCIITPIKVDETSPLTSISLRKYRNLGVPSTTPLIDGEYSLIAKFFNFCQNDLGFFPASFNSLSLNS